MMGLLVVAAASAVLGDLRLGSLDLLMLHGPSEPFGHEGGCSPLACALNAAQWRASRRHPA